MATNTTTYSFQKPAVGGDEDAWGGYLNGNWDKTDDLLDGTTPVTGIDINSGTIDGVVIGGAAAAAGTFAALTGTTVAATTLNVSTGLAANLSTNGFDITTTSNANLDLAPNGTGTSKHLALLGVGLIFGNRRTSIGGQKGNGWPQIEETKTES